MKINYLGLTQKEQIVLDKLMESYAAFRDLPKEHPSEIEEFVFAVHLIQGLLTTRIARRHYPKGWPTYESNHNKKQFININTLINRFDSIINGEGLVVPRIAIKTAIEELKDI